MGERLACFRRCYLGSMGGLICTLLWEYFSWLYWYQVELIWIKLLNYCCDAWIDLGINCNPAMHHSMVTQDFHLWGNTELLIPSDSARVSLGWTRCLQAWGLWQYLIKVFSEKINDGTTRDSLGLVYCIYVVVEIVEALYHSQREYRHRVLNKHPTVETRIKLP